MFHINMELVTTFSFLHFGMQVSTLLLCFGNR